MTTTNNKQASQQYQLKLGVIHDPALKTVQLIQFLQNQANQFLHNGLPQYVKGDQKFVNVMESIANDSTQLSQYEFEQYVGLLLIYSTSSDQSYQYFLKNVQSILQMDIGDLFLIVVEMDNSDKQANVVGNLGQKFSTKNGIQFVRLSLYNSEDLIALINKNLYELIENYYYPNEQQQPESKQEIILQTPSAQQPQFSNPLTDRSKKSNKQVPDKNSQYIFSYDDNSHTIKAFTESSPPPSGKAEEILSHAESLRKSREKQIQFEQKQIDESIENIENVLNNINHRIKQKLESGWFTSIKDKLYMTAEKDNQNFSKIKLTQEFIDEPEKKPKKNQFSSVIQSRYSETLNQTSKSFALNFNSLKFNTTLLRTPIIKMILFSSKDKVVELEVYENSTYDELAQIALKRLGIRQTDKNIEKMIQKIRRRIEIFCKQFQRAIKVNEQKKIQQRSFLKSKTNQQSVQRKA